MIPIFFSKEKPNQQNREQAIKWLQELIADCNKRGEDLEHFVFEGDKEFVDSQTGKKFTLYYKIKPNEVTISNGELQLATSTLKSRYIFSATAVKMSSELDLRIYTKIDGQRHPFLYRFLARYNEIQTILGDWIEGSDNFTLFWDALGQGQSYDSTEARKRIWDSASEKQKAKAALSTWTGRQAKKLGFGKVDRVVLDIDDVVHGIDEVRVFFKKSRNFFSRKKD